MTLTELVSTSIFITGKKKKTTASAKLLACKCVGGLDRSKSYLHAETYRGLLAPWAYMCIHLSHVVVAAGFEGRGDCMQQQEEDCS